MKQIRALWLIVALQTAAGGWLIWERRNPVPHAQWARVADGVSANSAIEQRLENVDKNVTRLMIDSQLQTDEDDERDDQIRIAQKTADTAFLLASENQEAAQKPNALNEYRQKANADAERAAVAGGLIDLDRKLKDFNGRLNDLEARQRRQDMNLLLRR